MYRHFIRTRLGGVDPKMPIPDHFMFQLDDLMKKDGIKFGITTLDPDISKIIRAYNPSEVVEHKNVSPGSSIYAGTDPDLLFLSRDIGKTYYMHFFTIDEIHRLATIVSKAPGMNGAPPVARSSIWQMLYDMSNPEIF